MRSFVQRSQRIIDKTDADIAVAADRLKALANVISAKLEAAGEYAADTPTHQYLARLAVHIVRQVEAICLLVAFPYFSEQAGQLVRGLTEATRIALWLDEPIDQDERLRRAVTFFKDGVTQMKDKVDYYESHSDAPYREDQTTLLAERLRQVEELEKELGESFGRLPSASKMLKDLDRKDLYSLFRWESDPSHASAIALGQTVAFETDSHHHLGGRNKPWDRVRRLGATLLLVQYAGRAIFSGLGFDTDEWDTSAREAEAEIEAVCSPYYRQLEEEEL